jgi:hypothetical protein
MKICNGFNAKEEDGVCETDNTDIEMTETINEVLKAENKSELPFEVTCKDCSLYVTGQLEYEIRFHVFIHMKEFWFPCLFGHCVHGSVPDDLPDYNYKIKFALRKYKKHINGVIEIGAPTETGIKSKITLFNKETVLFRLP